MSMKPEKLMELFEELAEKMDIKLVQEKGTFNGGTCICNEQHYIVLNKSKPIEQRLKVLAGVFHERDLSDTYLVPVLRTYIENVLEI